MARAHLDRAYEAELLDLRQRLFTMGGAVLEMIACSTHAVLTRDGDMARRVIARDRDVDQWEIETDGFCLRLLARRQPVASDLRFVATALKLVTDLERIGDLCVNVAERVIELEAEPPAPPPEVVTRMAALVGAMVRSALDAFAAADVDRAQALLSEDLAVDDRYGELYGELLLMMSSDPTSVRRAMRWQGIAKALERIGDHATNIGEMVVFMVQGKDIRHLAPRGRVPGRFAA